MKKLYVESVEELIEHVNDNTRIEHSTGCWLYEGERAFNHPNHKKYPKIGYKFFRTRGGNRKEDGWRNKQLYIHKVFCEMKYGEIPEGYQVDHICNNSNCHNPDHLRAISKETHQKITGLNFSVTRKKLNEKEAKDLAHLVFEVGMTQKEVAKLYHIDPSTLYRYLKMKHLVPIVI